MKPPRVGSEQELEQVLRVAMFARLRELMREKSKSGDPRAGPLALGGV